MFSRVSREAPQDVVQWTKNTQWSLWKIKQFQKTKKLLQTYRTLDAPYSLANGGGQPLSTLLSIKWLKLCKPF